MAAGASGDHVVEHGAAVVAAGDEGQAVDAAARHRRQLDDLLDERGRQVVDDVPAEVLEHVGGAGPSGTGHAR